MDELQKRKIQKIKEKLSEKDKKNYEKVETIIDEINNKQIKFLFLDNKFCINCNKCFKTDDERIHTSHLTLHVEKYNDNKDINIELKNLNYNSTLNDIYENIKKDQKKIIKTRNRKLIKYFEKILFPLYEIIINNNSIEELISSIININDNLSEIELETFDSFFKEYFLFYLYYISKLTYFKEQKIEQFLADLEDENNYRDLEINICPEKDKSNIKKEDKIQENSDDNCNNIIPIKMSEGMENIVIDFDNLKEEEKREIFLKIGFEIKYKSGNNKSISIFELYSKAKKQNISPFNYEDFIIKELNISS